MPRLHLLCVLAFGLAAPVAAQQPQTMVTEALVKQAPVEDAAWKISRGPWGKHWKATDPALQEALLLLRRRDLTAPQLQELLGRLFEAQPEMASQIVSTHTHWPEDGQIRCRLWMPSILFRPSLPKDVVIRARLLGVEDAPVVETVYEIWPGDLAADEIQPLLSPSGLPPGRYDIEVELYVGVEVSQDETDRHHYDIDRSAEMLAWKGVARTIEVGGVASDLLEPHDTEEARRAIVRSLKPQFYIDDRARPWLVMFRNCCHIGQGDEDWSLAGLAEVSRDGVVAARGSFVYPMVMPRANANFGNFYEVFPLTWVNDAPDGVDLDAADWEIRLAGDADIALRDLRRESYWSGTVTLPATWPKHRDYVSRQIKDWDRLEKQQ